MAEEDLLRLTICNQRGLHARASARFVELACQFKAEILVAKEEGQAVSGTSILGLMMLAAAKGEHICVRAAGPDAPQALKAIKELVEGRFGED